MYLIVGDVGYCIDGKLGRRPTTPHNEGKCKHPDYEFVFYGEMNDVIQHVNSELSVRNEYA